LTLSDFQYTERDVDKAIMANAISFTIAFSKKVKDLSKDGWSEVGQLSNGKILLVKFSQQYLRRNNSISKSYYTAAIHNNTILNTCYITRIISTQNFAEPGLSRSTLQCKFMEVITS
jgi:hypothetical protein